MANFKQLLLIGVLALAVCGNGHAADGEKPIESLQPSAWAARGFVPPVGEPQCIDLDTGSLNEAGLKRICEEAKLGNANAQHNLGQLFFLARDAEESHADEAYKWFSLAAEQKLPASQYALGLMHFYGLGIVGDRRLAMSWMTKAADNGHMNAQYLLGLHYASPMRGAEKHMDDATKWLRLAAAQGHDLAQEVLTNILKRMAVSPTVESGPMVEYDVKISHAACAEDFDINNPKSYANPDRQFTWNDVRAKKSNKYTYFALSDLIRAIQESHEKYAGSMETCLRGLASVSGAGHVKFDAR